MLGGRVVVVMMEVDVLVVFLLDCHQVDVDDAEILAQSGELGLYLTHPWCRSVILGPCIESRMGA